jgi:hypothetical protein
MDLFVEKIGKEKRKVEDALVNLEPNESQTAEYDALFTSCLAEVERLTSTTSAYEVIVF